MPKFRKKKKAPKRVLALPDLEQAKSAVLNTLTSKSGQRTYEHAITKFVEWYCSEPRHTSTLSSGRAKLVVTALRSFFRYLLHQGRISVDLSRCVLPVAVWSISTLPKFLPPEAVQRLLVMGESSHLGRTPPSVESAPSRGAPVSDDPRNRARPLGSVKFRPFARCAPSLAR